MSAQQNNKLPVLLGWVNIGLGLVLFLAYGAYLPVQEKLISAGIPDPGLALYALATAGGAFVAWGMLLRGIDGNVVSRAALLKASGVGFALLGLMRVGTAVFPHAPFNHMVALPVAESVVFIVLALRLLKAA